MQRSYLGVYIVVVLLATPLWSQSNSERALLEKEFGASQAKDADLYQYNRDYAIRISLDRQTNAVIKAEIAPKYFFQDLRSDWSEEPETNPNLKRADYDAIISRFRDIWSIGNFRTTTTVVLVTNLRARFVDLYENAVAERVQMSTTESNIFSSTVWFRRRVSGVIQDSLRFDTDTGVAIFKVKLGGCWYWAMDKKFRLGEFSQIDVAGPTDNSCETCKERSPATGKTVDSSP